VISGNLIKQNNSWRGGGIFCDHGAYPEISDNIIETNTAQQGGGLYFGPYSYYLPPAILGNTILSNSAVQGGGVFMERGMLLHNTIGQNSAYSGGGLFLQEGMNESIVNCRIFRNQATWEGGGVYANAGSVPTIQGCTLAANIAKNGAGLWINASAKVTVVNSILWDDPSSEILDNSQESVIAFSNVRNGWPGTGNIDADPLFVDPANDDYHLRYTSPCRGAGYTPIVDQPFDFEGDPRVALGHVDMGADEFHPHCYVTGDKAPGGNVAAHLIGLPSTSPLALLIGSDVLENPVVTPWGRFYLEAPWLLLSLDPLEIPSDGVLSIPAAVPPNPAAPYDLPMQALIGLKATSLSNLEILEVR